MKITMDDEVRRGYGVGSRLLKPREQLP